MARAEHARAAARCAIARRARRDRARSRASAPDRPEQHAERRTARSSVGVERPRRCAALQRQHADRLRLVRPAAPTDRARRQRARRHRHARAPPGRRPPAAVHDQATPRSSTSSIASPSVPHQVGSAVEGGGVRDRQSRMHVRRRASTPIAHAIAAQPAAPARWRPPAPTAAACDPAARSRAGRSQRHGGPRSLASARARAWRKRSTARPGPVHLAQRALQLARRAGAESSTTAPYRRPPTSIG